MSERLVSRRLFQNVPVSGTAVSGPQSSAISLQLDVLRMESLTFTLSSPTSTPDVGFFYAVSPDGVTFGSYADTPTILTSTFTLANPQGYNVVALPLALAPYIKFSCSGTGSNPQDCRVVTADLWLRLG